MILIILKASLPIIINFELMKKEDPLSYFITNYSYDKSLVESWACGDKYLACLFNDGRMGVCALLGNKITTADLATSQPCPEKISHRIILNAYYNALFNYNRTYSCSLDIYDKVDFRKYKKIVVAGYFSSLAEKFKTDGLEVHFFDLHKQIAGLLPMENQAAYISDAECLILSATAIFNGTFSRLLEKTVSGTDVYLLGPSSILHDYMLEFPGIKNIFGMVFYQNQAETMKIISRGSGTRDFGKLGIKVYI